MIYYIGEFMRKCYYCKFEKNEGEFSASQLKRSGSLCRSCNTKIVKEYRNKNLDKIKKYQQDYDIKYYQKNKDQILNKKKVINRRTINYTI